MNGIYIGTMGMMNNLNRIDTHANNIANVDTSGYKFDQMVNKVFSHQKMYRNDDFGSTFIGDYNDKVTYEGKRINLKEGSINLTNKEWDFNIRDTNPENAVSFFVVEKNNERFLTRNGQFTVDDQRRLVTFDGSFVLNANNERIVIPENVEVSKDSKGNLVNEENGLNIATIQIKTLSLQDRANLDKHQDSSFRLNNLNIDDLADFNGELMNGVYERSNVNITEELVSLLESQRRVTASQNIVSTFNKVYEKEVNEILK